MIPSQERKVDNLPLLLQPAPALVCTPVPETYPGLDTALRSEALLLTKKRSAIGITTCACTAAPPAIGLLNAPIRDLAESPLLLLPPPQKEVCPFLLPRLFCLLLPLPLLKSYMRQKTKFRCS